MKEKPRSRQYETHAHYHDAKLKGNKGAQQGEAPETNSGDSEDFLP